MRTITRICGLLTCFVVGGLAAAETAPSFDVVRRFEAPEARQGVAVDTDYFYAIDSRGIGKYDKRSGRRVGKWQASKNDAIIHLNSGVIIDGKLYCAHSNYPSVPMVSTIEIFDPKSLVHLSSQRLPDGNGSATWVDRSQGAWWVVFANYEGRGGQPGKGPATTVLVRFDPAWSESGRYTFPPPVVTRFGTRSNSGGTWGSDGLLYATGHAGAEIYVLRLPAHGSVLDLVGIVSAGIDGQGIAWDRAAPGALYGIVKKAREVVVLR